jgi:hypothetical protein
MEMIHKFSTSEESALGCKFILCRTSDDGGTLLNLFCQLEAKELNHMFSLKRSHALHLRKF